MATNQVNKYIWLVDTIHRAGKISLEEINRRWIMNDMSEGVDIPKRTFHKWRIAIEEMFGLIIENENRGEYRYYIANDEEIKQNELSSWMIDTISTSNLLMNNKSLKERILLEDIPSGKTYLQPIIEAMKENRIIQFTYYNYWRGDLREHTIEPYCVKLFRQRWYLVGKVHEGDKIYVYSLDRMSKFQQLETSFKFPSRFDARGYFEDCFGVVPGDSKPQLIRLKATPQQANYLRALPLKDGHQTEVERNDEFSIFEIKLNTTFDLEQEILWQGENVEILEPPHFREAIAKRIEQMWNHYKEDK